MTTTIVGLFDHFDDVHDTIQDLEKMGLTRREISVVASASTTGSDYVEGDVVDGAAVGAGTGAVAGSAIGGTVGLLAGLGALAIPGFGPVVAAGPLVAAITGAGLGAAAGAGAGGLIGALTETGISEEEAGHYAEAVGRGSTLMTVVANENDARQVVETMNRNNAARVNQHGTGSTAESPILVGAPHRDSTPRADLRSAAPRSTGTNSLDDINPGDNESGLDINRPGGDIVL